MVQMNQTLLIAILSPILVTFGGLLTWFFKSRKDSLLAIEERAREKRLKTYEIIIEPMIAIFSANGNKNLETKATRQILSLEYKKASFNLVTFGSDEMVRTFNKMMQYFYLYNPENDPDFTSNTMKVFCDFLLAIRKDLNDPNTTLKRRETIEFLIKDLHILNFD